MLIFSQPSNKKFLEVDKDSKLYRCDENKKLLKFNENNKKKANFKR